MARINRFAAATAFAAALSLSATPAMARGHHWHHRHHDGIDAGDVLVGAVIIGGIAAIASAASKERREDRAPAPPPYPDDRQGYRYDAPGRDVGLDHAADMCADAVERGHDRVDSVDGVTRDREGWAVSGRIEGGAPFSCRIDNNGRLRGVEIDRGSAGYQARGDQQYGDDYYARARAAQGGAQHDGAAPDDSDEVPPAWVADRPEWRGDRVQPETSPQDDGRYEASQTPDFGQGV